MNIKHTRTLAHPPERVWAALTNGEQLSRWLMPNDFQPQVGHKFQFRADPAPGFDGIVNCEVLTIRDRKLLEITWVGGGIDTVVAFMLEAVEGGTRLTVRQDGFKVSNMIAYAILGAGWRKILGKKLPSHLDDASTVSVGEARTA